MKRHRFDSQHRGDLLFFLCLAVADVILSAILFGLGKVTGYLKDNPTNIFVEYLVFVVIFNIVIVTVLCIVRAIVEFDERKISR